MKTFHWLPALVIFACSCQPGINSSAVCFPQPLSVDDYVLVLQPEESFVNDGLEIGKVKSGDTDLSANCSYDELQIKLRRIARTKGANVVRIEKRRDPDFWNNRIRLKATLYKVPDFHKHEKEIEWSATRRLTWEDFKGVPKQMSNSRVAALTYCGFSFQVNKTAFSKKKVLSRNFFSCDNSWVMPKSIGNAELLEHEQRHFDLSELYSRELKKRLREKKMTVLSLGPEAQAIFKELHLEYTTAQQKYDTETNHGLEHEIQLAWSHRIATQLNELGVLTSR